MTDQTVHHQNNGASGRRLPFGAALLQSVAASVIGRTCGKRPLPIRKGFNLGHEDELPSGEGWAEWTGGPCPVDRSLVVEVVRWSSTGFVHHFGEAGSIGWRWANGSRPSVTAGNVLAFRIADALNNQAYAEAIRMAFKNLEGAGGDRDLDLGALKSSTLAILAS